MQDKNLSKSIKIGATCIAAYIASYYMRNLLGVLTPTMLQTGEYTKEFIGLLNSTYMVIYAAGQLINGLLGDRIKPKIMIVIGLGIAGMSSILFPFSMNWVFQIVCFGAWGFGLSMLRGPMMKVISENTVSNHARVICAFFSMSSFIGPFIAGLFAFLFQWKRAFAVSGVVALIIAIAAYIVLTYLEKKNMIKTQLTIEKRNENLLAMFKIDKFFLYMFIGAIAETAGSAISFWIPTYLSEYLSFDNNTANFIYAIKSVLSSSAPFVTLIIYKIIKNDITIIKCSYLVSGILFIGMIFVNNTWANILFFFIALFASAISSSMLWSIYIPSLASTGRVSSSNGILNCAGYIGAAIANAVTANIMDKISWSGIIAVWSGIMFLGFFATVLYNLVTRKYRTSSQMAM